jgi:hypothetical protein
MKLMAVSRDDGPSARSRCRPSALVGRNGLIAFSLTPYSNPTADITLGPYRVQCDEVDAASVTIASHLGAEQRTLFGFR